MTKHPADLNGDRLLQLSNEVSRIAGDLARMSTASEAVADESAGGSAREVSAQRVMAVIRARRLRVRYFPEELFSDPAWDMLLNLFHAELSFRRVTVSSLSMAAAVPPTTAIRWINSLVEKGLFFRRSDPHDGRRVYVELTPETSAALRTYFAQALPIDSA